MTEEQALPLRFGPAIHNASSVAILMHGRERNPEEMRDLALRLDLPSMHYILPAAPDNSWYPESFTAPVEHNEPWMSQTLAQYDSLVNEVLEAGVPLAQIVIGGFSQGAVVTAELLVRFPRHYGAALIFTGALMGPAGTAWPRPAELSGLPIYMSSSAVDEWIPVSRFREAEKFFIECGAAVRTRFFENRPHIIADEEVSDARMMLRDLGIAHGS
jgi:phospholipase/carboxylesterase